MLERILNTYFVAFWLCLNACSQQLNEDQLVKSNDLVPGSIGIVGDPKDIVVENLQGGIVLMGGGTDVDEAMLWMASRSLGGDFVIIRATGSTGYNEYINELATLNSVETLLINSRELADNELVANRIKEAEALFIAGGDQANYVNFWKGTKVADAINYLIEQKKAVIGGTSAGCAILGDIVFAAKNGTITSEEALNNPYHNRVSIEKGMFIDLPILNNVITDQHYSQRSRQGRHAVFLAFSNQAFSVLSKGIGVDERTALCIDDHGIGRVIGSHHVYFLWSGANPPEIMESETPLTWNMGNQAINLYTIKGSKEHNLFDLNDWAGGSHQGGIRGFMYIESGVIYFR